MKKLLVVSNDEVGSQMAGPGIRAWHLASELAKHFPTTLVARREGDLPGPADFRVIPHGAESEQRRRHS